MKTNLIVAIVLLAIGIAIGFFIHKEGFTIKAQTETVYRTDTIYKDRPFLKPVTIDLEEAKPHIVTKYRDSPTNNELIKKNDSLFVLVKDLEDSISKPHYIYVPTESITKYPKSPKFLSMVLNRDTLGLTLLNTSDGTITSLDYPLFLNKYRYTHDGKVLYKEDIPGFTKNRYQSNNNKHFTPEVYLYGGYHSYFNMPLVSAELALSRNITKFAFEATMITQKNPQFIFTGKFGIRLKRWQEKK